MTQIIAHRGFSGVAPENTLIAFKKAIEFGADYFELDVHKTKDDSIIVIHDKTVNRTSSNNMDGKISQMTFQELNKVKVGFSEKFDDKFINDNIPTLREALQLAKGKIKVCVEVKVDSIEKDVLKIINDIKMNEDVIIFSFHYNILNNIRQLDKNIPLLYLTNYADTSTISYVGQIGINAIGVGYNTNPSKKYIAEANKNGIEIWKWTVNDEKQMRDLINIGIDGLITNYPDKALTIRNKFDKNISDVK